jgi:DNA-binding transcriptional ArsR family regulator
VSRLIEPPVPQEVAVFYDTVGNRVRGKIVSLLSAAGSMSTAELMERLDMDRSYVIKHMKELEAAGLVVADRPREQRRGRVLQWSVNPERREEMIAAFADFLRGETGTSAS